MHMSIKVLLTQDMVLLRCLFFDQWYLQRCYVHFQAIKIVSHVPDPEILQKYVCELVCSLSFIYSSTSILRPSLRCFLGTSPPDYALR